MLLAIQFTHGESHLYSCTRLQKLEILSLSVVQCLAVYASVASKTPECSESKRPWKHPYWVNLLLLEE